MASVAQIQANRLNAQKSTGPRTAVGKERASRNAVKHGLLAREAVIRGEDPEEFERYRQWMLESLAPAGAVGGIKGGIKGVRYIFSAHWRNSFLAKNLSTCLAAPSHCLECHAGGSRRRLPRCARNDIRGKLRRHGRFGRVRRSEWVHQTLCLSPKPALSLPNGAGSERSRTGSQREKHHGPAFLALSASLRENRFVTRGLRTHPTPRSDRRSSAFISGSLSPWPPCLCGEDSPGACR